ncbi:hypothetical protein KKC97_05085, partial [bacterium]|nr:hypothetical protein [bacterium]
MSGQLRLALVGLLCTTIPLFAVTIDGTATLQGETDHSGIRVLFSEASPSAATDSAFTDESGFFSLDLAIGIYVVEYSHAGYVTYSTEEIGLTTATELDSVMLFSEATSLSGNLSGTLSAGEYWVVGNIAVSEGDELVLEPGVQITFTGFYSFSVNGALTAIGTATDSIRFTRFESGNVDYWDKVGLQNGNTYRFEYCVFEYAGAGTIFNNAVLELVHCSFRYNLDCLRGHGTLALIDNCSFVENISDIEGIIIIENVPAEEPFLIINSSFIDNDNGDFGVIGSLSLHGSDEIRIENCVFRSNSGIMAGAVSVLDGRLTAVDCEFSGNNSWFAGGIYCAADICEIVNCTFVENSPCGARVGSNSTSINSCLFAYNNGTGIDFSDAPDAEVQFCNFWENTDGSVGHPDEGPLLLGQILTVNQNNDSSDVYYNISQDPMFVNLLEGDFHLLESSRCIDAGDTTLTDPDGTICDIGAYYYTQPTAIDPMLSMPVSHELLSNYPNPFNPSTNINFVV